MTFYITTPIYYVNDVPHLGHAYTTIVADALARFHRMRGEDTRFLTGTDEHGQKVEETAKKKGMTPQQLVDHVAPRFDETWKTLGIEGYRFIRTTDAKHKRVVAALWKRIKERNPGDLYLASYQGWYCVGCEAFYTESQLVKDGDRWLCSVHKQPVNWIDKERSWFFRLSRYAEPLLDHIAKNPDFIRPEAYRKEIVAFLSGEVRGHSIGYLVAEKGFLDWDDYQAATDVFPVRFNAGVKGPQPLETNIDEFHPGRCMRIVDRIYTWRMRPDSPVQPRLRYHYKVIAVHGDGRLWERRLPAP